MSSTVMAKDAEQASVFSSDVSPVIWLQSPLLVSKSASKECEKNKQILNYLTMSIFYCEKDWSSLRSIGHPFFWLQTSVSNRCYGLFLYK